MRRIFHQTINPLDPSWRDRHPISFLAVLPLARRCSARTKCVHSKTLRPSHAAQLRCRGQFHAPIAARWWGPHAVGKTNFLDAFRFVRTSPLTAADSRGHLRRAATSRTSAVYTLVVRTSATALPHRGSASISVGCASNGSVLTAIPGASVVWARAVSGSACPYPFLGPHTQKRATPRLGDESMDVL